MSEKLRASFSATLTFENPPRLWALMRGGRQIPPLVLPPNFLLDSNAVTDLRDRHKMLSPEKEWWDALLELNITVLNPVPNAFEGKSGICALTREEFEERFKEDAAMLQRSFPKVQVIHYDQAAFDGVFEMIQTVASANESENDFLVAIAPSIVDAAKERGRRAVEDTILRIASDHGLRSDSFALYGTLSSIYAAGSKFQIARKILKPTSIVEKSNAYNALSDLSLLRLLTAAIAYFPSHEFPTPALLTADKNLIKFWCALNVKNFTVNEKGSAAATFSFSEPMFPTLDENERHELSQRVASI